MIRSRVTPTPLHQQVTAINIIIYQKTPQKRKEQIIEHPYSKILKKKNSEKLLVAMAGLDSSSSPTSESDLDRPNIEEYLTTESIQESPKRLHLYSIITSPNSSLFRLLFVSPQSKSLISRFFYGQEGPARYLPYADGGSGRHHRCQFLFLLLSS